MTPKRQDHQSKYSLLPFAGALICISLWEINSRFQLYQFVAPSMSPSTFPSFFSIAIRLGYFLFSSAFWESVSVTIMRTLLAFAIAALLGTLLGLLAGRSRVIDALVKIPIEFFRNLPAIAAMPIFILFFGIGTSMKIAICIFGAMFPVFVATRIGIQNIAEDINIAARFYHWSGWRLIFLVLLPAALPEIAAASQTALAISLILAVMGEMLIGGDGLGNRIVDAERTFNHLDLYALILSLGILGCALAVGFRWTMSRLIFWKSALNWQEA